ncbi:hypothetical protein QFC22_004572 [Naganishia vaughanmartiniae]|uniref:Uncharacterized protein n=1 Tax=Naganishia vaughanmartiniae TaxID=1424756 RepID=A0ACC2X010_9TREE|nr:hypothetical protein QFC22_004572 [Naganishia vaughanmartiniae]
MPMLSYKAGRAIRRSEDSNWVDPVPEKGTLAFEVVDDLAQLGEFFAKAFRQRCRGTDTRPFYLAQSGRAVKLGATRSEKYLLFPEDVQVEAVSSDPTGRTYVFKFSSSDQRLFYWFQDIDSTKYAEFANKINGFLASPDSHSAGRAAEPAPEPALAAAAATSISTDSSQPPLSTATGIPQTPAPNPTVKSSTTTTTTTTTLAPGAPRANRVGQLMGLGGARGEESTPSSGRGQAAAASASTSTTTTATGSTAGAQAHQFTQEQLGALAALLGGSQAGNAGTGATGYPGLQEGMFIRSHAIGHNGGDCLSGADWIVCVGGVGADAHLSDILTASTITPLLLSNPALITRLIPHLPADLPLSTPPKASEIQELVSTPQWTEAVAAFDAALRTGGLQGVMPSLGLKVRAGNGVREFLEEVEEAAEGKKEDKMDTE